MHFSGILNTVLFVCIEGYTGKEAKELTINCLKAKLG